MKKYSDQLPKAGDLVRYSYGSFDEIGIFMSRILCGDFVIYFAENARQIRVPRTHTGYVELVK